MKYFIAFLGAVFLAFAGLILYGWSLPQTFIFEQSTDVAASTDDIYAEMADMQNIRIWGPYVSGLGLEDTALTGTERGSGQVIDWRRSVPPFEVGSQEILALTPPYFVQNRFSSPPYNGSVIYAINQGLPTDVVTVLVRLDLDVGGFPFFNRVKLRLKKGTVDDELLKSLLRLKTITER